MTIHAVILGLNNLLLEPNPEDPLNKEAADVMARDLRQFEQNVQSAMQGNSVNGVKFDRILAK